MTPEQRADRLDASYSGTLSPLHPDDIAMCRKAAALIRAQAERVRVLEEALKPFAMVAAHDIGSDESDTDTFKPISDPQWAVAPLLTVGDLRIARAALNAGGAA